MSSAISTDSVSTKPIPPRPADDSLQPWQFFVLAALACATAVTFIVRGQGITAVVLLTVLMAALAFVGLTSLRTVLPLTGAYEDRTSMIGERTRAALEREVVRRRTSRKATSAPGCWSAGHSHRAAVTTAAGSCPGSAGRGVPHGRLCRQAKDHTTFTETDTFCEPASIGTAFAAATSMAR